MAKIAAIIGWVGTALVVVALGLRFIKPELDVYRTYTAWAGLACILVYLVAQWRESSTGASARSTKLGTMSVVSIVAMLSILAGLNYIGVRHPFQGASLPELLGALHHLADALPGLKPDRRATHPLPGAAIHFEKTAASTAC